MQKKEPLISISGSIKLRVGARFDAYQNTPKKVICIETGAVYNSLAEARRQTGAKNISACCVNERNTSGGYHWRYLD